MAGPPPTLQALRQLLAERFPEPPRARGGILPTGLEGIEDASTLLLEPHEAGVKTAGSVITAALQGTRVLMVEVQALTTDAMLGAAKRKVSGADSSRGEFRAGRAGSRLMLPCLAP